MSGTSCVKKRKITKIKADQTRGCFLAGASRLLQSRANLRKTDYSAVKTPYTYVFGRMIRLVDWYAI